MISIITATFNRAYILPKLYESIIKNKRYDGDLEWIIIDDGSKDETEKLVKSWIKENKVKIKYFKQKNSGKMAAINNYILEVENELLMEIDSDDYLTDDAFNKILTKYEKIKNNKKCYGLLFRVHFIGKENQTKFPLKNTIIKMFDLYNKESFSLDAKQVFKSTIRKKYKYELENNEKFVTEARMYNKIDLEYDGLYLVDEEIVNCEYLEDGYSKNIKKLFLENPYGYFEYFKECFNMNFNGINFKKRLYFIKHYILFGYLTGRNKVYVVKECKGIVNKLLIIILIIPGYIKSRIDFSRKN